MPAAHLVLVDVQTDHGVVGTAYIFADTPLTLRPLVAFARTWAKALWAWPPILGMLLATLRRSSGCWDGRGLSAWRWRAFAGVDMKLWDAQARAVNLPISSHLFVEGQVTDRGPGLGIVWGEDKVVRHLAR
jgi:mandelate racemase